MQRMKVLFCLMLALTVTTTGFAQDNDKKKARAKKAMDRAVKNTTTQMMKTFSKADLSDEQKEKAKAIIEKHIGDLIKARKAQDGLLTAEQKKARTEAIAKAKEEGTKGNKLAAIGTKAMGLSEEELKKFTEAKKSVNQATGKIRNAIMELLTDEQKATLPKRKGKRGKKKKDGADKDSSKLVALTLPEMKCGGCAASVQKALATLDGVEEIKTNVEDKTCTFKAPADMNVKATLDKFVKDGNKQLADWSIAKGPAY